MVVLRVCEAKQPACDFPSAYPLSSCTTPSTACPPARSLPCSEDSDINHYDVFSGDAAVIETQLPSLLPPGNQEGAISFGDTNNDAMRLRLGSFGANSADAEGSTGLAERSSDAVEIGNQTVHIDGDAEVPMDWSQVDC